MYLRHTQMCLRQTQMCYGHTQMCFGQAQMYFRQTHICFRESQMRLHQKQTCLRPTKYGFIFDDFWSCRAHNKCIWSKIWRGSWWSGPLASKSKKKKKNPTLFCRTVFFAEIVFSAEKWHVANRLKRVFPNFRGERTWFRGVIGRSKFRFFFQNRQIGRFGNW